MSEANLETRVAILETHVENQKDTLNRIEAKLETVSQTLNDITRDFNDKLNNMSRDLNNRIWHLVWQLPLGIAAIAGITVTVLEVIL